MSVETAAERGIEYLTLFAFSSENWSRPEEEVSSLMSLFIEALRREVDELHHNNVQLKFIGSRGQLSRRLQEKIAKAEEKTAGNTGLHLTVAIAYGGRWDIIEASKAVAREVAAGSLNADDIDDAVGGEQRISNFLLWNLAYAELWFTDVLWPDFSQDVFDAALSFYAGKQRRFGHTGEQVQVV
jgi:undecaprenyl diphosphate synthase